VLRLTQGSPPDLASRAAIEAIKPRPIRRSRSGEGSEGGRFTGSTDDSGPGKPGNRAEDKTLKTRESLDVPNVVAGAWEIVDERRQ